MSADHVLDLQEAAERYRISARTPEEEAYFRGYIHGVARRSAGGNGHGEVDPYAIEQEVKDTVTRALGAGYRDGLAGEPLRRRKEP